MFADFDVCRYGEVIGRATRSVVGCDRRALYVVYGEIRYLLQGNPETGYWIEVGRE